MSFVIFGDLFSFPEGYAAANRVHSYAKGMTENGTTIHIICFSNDYLSVSYGSFEGINYYYPFNQSKRSKLFIVRRWKKLLKYINTFSLVRRINKQEKITGINLWTTATVTFLFAWMMSMIFHSKLILECSEHPLRNYQDGFFRKKIGKIKFKIEARMSSGILCISNYILELYKSSGLSEHKLLLVPSTVDPSRFSVPIEKPVHYRYIGYFGSLSFGRDNIDMLIKAFAEIQHQYPDLHLILGGYCIDDERENLKNMIREFNLESKVEILEYLSRKEIISFIQNADILVMVRSDDLESKASFPSKLTEYLAASRPVIAVDVGEISDYLKDGENAYLVKAGNVRELADKMKYVLGNYETALKTAICGKELTSGVFNYKYQAARILEFVNHNKEFGMQKTEPYEALAK